MNKSYKSVWNESTGSWVAVSELATGRSKSKRAKTAISKAILTQVAVGGMSLAGVGVAMADDTVKQGTNAAVNIADGVAIGVNSEVDADTLNPAKIGGIAIGDSAYAIGSGVAVGENSQAGSDSLAFGSGAAAQNGGTAIGANSYSINNGGVAIGEGATATGAGGMAIGKNASASASGAVAIGQDSVATGMNTVSVGNVTTQRQITNLAAGTKATDAVNVGQLTAAGLVVNSSGVAQNSFVAYDAGSAKALISLQGASGTKITNLLAGTVSSSSKDAINGSQLYNVAQSAADALGGSSTVGADGKITKPTYKIGNNDYTSLDSALSAAAASGSGGGDVTNAVTYTDGAHTSVSLGNGTAPVSIKNVATGVDANDAVNVAQLKSATDGVSGIVTKLPYIGISASMSGDSAVATGNNSVAIGGFSYANADNALAFGTKARALAANSVAIGAGSLANKANTVSIGAGNAERRLTNMAAGVDETDGVNLGQMMAYVDENLVSQNVQSSGLLKSSVRSNGLLGASPTPFGLSDVMAVGTTDKLNQIEALGADAMAMGLNTHANGDSSVAVGSNTSAAGLASVGVGYGVIVNGNGASAFGVNSSSISDGGFAAGNGAAVQANSNDGVAIGTNAETSGVNGVSVGNTARAWGAGSVAIGGSTKAAGANSVVIGTGSSATTAAAGSVVLGNNNLVTGANTVVLGSNTVGTGTKKNTVSGANSVVLGDGSDGSLSNVVSVGAAGKERRIVNVAAGTTTTDAVNLGQLNSAIAAIPSGGSVSPETVVYDTSAHDKLTFNKSGNPTTLSNVAAGVTANDAVNVGQLTAAGLSVDSTGKATNAFVAYDNNTSKDTITLKGTSGSTKITALTKGTLSATSTDAVNGSQLFNTASSTAAAIGGGAALDPATGTISKPAIKVGDTTFDNVAGAVTAAGTTAAQALAASVDAVKYDTTAHDKVTLGTVGKPVTLTNVADGKTTYDAVNYGQLSAMGAKIGSDGKATNAFVAYDDTSMNTVTLQGASGSTKITKLTKGTLSATSTDAINGSQLFNTASSTAAAIGGGAALDPATGTISKPAIKVGGTTYSDLVSAIQAVGTGGTVSPETVVYDTTAHDKLTFNPGKTPTTLSNVAAGVTANDAVNVGQLTAAGLSVDSTGKATNAFVAYDNNTSKDTITLKGTSGSTKITALTKGTLSATSTDAVNGSQLFNTASSTAAAAAIGGGAALDPATGTISKPAIKVGDTTFDNVAGAVTAAGTTATTAATDAAAAKAAVADAVKYDSTAHDKVTLGTVGKPVTLTNVADGKTTYDAVNFSQLSAMGAKIGSDGKVTNSFVAYDDTSMNTVTLQGASGSTKITKLTKGTLSATSTDAINGSQLFNTASSTAAAIGGGAALDPATGTISKPAIKVGDTTFDNVAGAVAAAGTTAAQALAGSIDAVKYDSTAHDTVTLGGKSAATPVTLSNVAQGKVGTDAVNLDQLTALGGQVDSTGKALNAFVAYDSAEKTTVTLNKGGAATTISNVAAGVSATDAVNVAQLNAATSDNVILTSALKYVRFGASTAATAQATGTDSTALGGNSFASGKASLALGLNARATAENSVAIGMGSLANTKNTVSVGTASATRRIVNVGDATDDNDAVNLHQVTEMLDAANAVQSQQSQQLLKSSTRQLLGASPLAWTDVIAVGPSDKAHQIEAMGTDAMAFGVGTHANGDNSLAIGTNVSATAEGSVGVGSNVISNGIEATAVGVGASVIADHGLALGYNSASEQADSIAIGSGATVGLPDQGTQTRGIAIGAASLVNGDGSIVLGNKSTVSGDNTVALGNNIKKAVGSNSVILGAGSDGSQSNVVSVGAKGTERKIVNVAAGTTTTDAVNYGQLNAAIASVGSGGGGGSSLVTQPIAGGDLFVGTDTNGGHVNFAGTTGNRELIGLANGKSADSAATVGQMTPVVTALGGGAKIDPTTGAVTGPTYSIQGANKSTVGDALTALDGGLSTVNTKIDALGNPLVTQASAGSDLLVGSKADGTHVNFAGTAGNRELINVAAGTKDTSAVNLSQLKPVVAGLGGGAGVDAAGNVTGPSYTIQGSTVNNAGDAFTKIDGNLTDLKTTVSAITAGGDGLVIQDPTSGDIKVGSVNGGTVVDMTGTAGARTITGVAAGSLGASSFDAINGSQLNATTSNIATAIGGGMSVDSKTGAITMPSFSVGGQTMYNVGDAITGLDGRIDSTNNSLTELTTKVSNISTGGTGTATPNAVAYDTDAHDTLTLASTSGGTTKLSGLTDGNVAAGSTDAVTGNQLSEVKDSVTTLQTTVNNIAETGTTVIGVKGADGTNGINGANGVAGSNGTAASANGADAIAMGDNASASGDHAVVIGGGASGTADGVIAIGGNSNASGKDSIAIGNGATAPDNNSVALGAGSTTDRDNSVSIGSEGKERQLTNVAAGTAGTDAVNLNQMNQAVGGVARKAYSGIAAATALTMIPDVDANKTLSIGIGGGTFQGYAATAIGGTARITQNIKVRVGAGWSAAGTTVGAGASYQW